MEINTINCFVLIGVLGVTVLTYIILACIYLMMGGCLKPGPGPGLTITMCRCANSRPVHLVLQLLALGALLNG